MCTCFNYIPPSILPGNHSRISLLDQSTTDSIIIEENHNLSHHLLTSRDPNNNNNNHSSRSSSHILSQQQSGNMANHHRRDNNANNTSSHGTQNPHHKRTNPTNVSGVAGTATNHEDFHSSNYSNGALQSNQAAKMFVGGLPQSVMSGGLRAPLHCLSTADSLREYFSSFGPVQEAFVLMDESSGRSRGFGFVTFDTAATLMHVLNSRPHILDNKQVDCKHAVMKGQTSRDQQHHQNQSQTAHSVRASEVDASSGGNGRSLVTNHNSAAGGASFPSQSSTSSISNVGGSGAVMLGLMPNNGCGGISSSNSWTSAPSNMRNLCNNNASRGNNHGTHGLLGPSSVGNKAFVGNSVQDPFVVNYNHSVTNDAGSSSSSSSSTAAGFTNNMDGASPNDAAPDDDQAYFLTGGGKSYLALSGDKWLEDCAEADERKIFVGGLPDVTPAEFASFFEHCGPVADAMVMFDRKRRRQRGFGFITFATKEGVHNALQYHHHPVKGKLVEVKKAHPLVLQNARAPAKLERDAALKAQAANNNNNNSNNNVSSLTENGRGGSMNNTMAGTASTTTNTSITCTPSTELNQVANTAPPWSSYDGMLQNHPAYQQQPQLQQQHHQSQSDLAENNPNWLNTNGLRKDSVILVDSTGYHNGTQDPFEISGPLKTPAVVSFPQPKVNSSFSLNRFPEAPWNEDLATGRNRPSFIVNQPLLQQQQPRMNPYTTSAGGNLMLQKNEGIRSGLNEMVADTSENLHQQQQQGSQRKQSPVMAYHRTDVNGTSSGMAAMYHPYQKVPPSPRVSSSSSQSHIQAGGGIVGDNQADLPYHNNAGLLGVFGKQGGTGNPYAVNQVPAILRNNGDNGHQFAYSHHLRQQQQQSQQQTLNMSREMNSMMPAFAVYGSGRSVEG